MIAWYSRARSSFSSPMSALRSTAVPSFGTITSSVMGSGNLQDCHAAHLPVIDRPAGVPLRSEVGDGDQLVPDPASLRLHVHHLPDARAIELVLPDPTLQRGVLQSVETAAEPAVGHVHLGLEAQDPRHVFGDVGGE